MSVKQTTFFCTCNVILDHWLSSKINLYKHYVNIASNRFNRYFDSLIKLFSQVSKLLLNFSEAIKRLSDMSRVASISIITWKNIISSKLIVQLQVTQFC